jgi:hypothetical protein
MADTPLAPHRSSRVRRVPLGDLGICTSWVNATNGQRFPGRRNHRAATVMVSNKRTRASMARRARLVGLAIAFLVAFGLTGDLPTQSVTYAPRFTLFTMPVSLSITTRLRLSGRRHTAQTGSTASPVTRRLAGSTTRRTWRTCQISHDRPSSRLSCWCWSRATCPTATAAGAGRPPTATTANTGPTSGVDPNDLAELAGSGLRA